MEYTIQHFKDLSEKLGKLDVLSADFVKEIFRLMTEAETALAVDRDRASVLCAEAYIALEKKMTGVGDVFSSAFKRDVLRAFEQAGKHVRRGPRLEDLKLLDVLMRPDAPEFIMSLGALNESFIPELWKLRDIGDEGHKDNYLHTLGVLRNVIDGETDGPDLELRLVALYHDVGKAWTKRTVEGRHGNAKVVFHDHENVSARMLPAALAKHFIPFDESMKRVQKIISLHGRPPRLTDMTDSAVRRLMVDAEGVFDKLMEFCRHDSTTKSAMKRLEYKKHMSELLSAAEDLARRDAEAAYRPPIDGHDIMTLMNDHGVTDNTLIRKIKEDVVKAIKAQEVEENRGACLAYVRRKYFA